MRGLPRISVYGGNMSSTTTKSRGKGRTRNYATVVYPESAPENWRDLIIESHIPCFVSPLHDKDINPTGEQKKPHYHVMIMYDSVKTEEQARDFFKTIGGVGCEIVNSIRGMARYLKHLDNPEKYQYKDDVDCYAGADYMAAIGTMADKAKAIRQMQNWIQENDIICFADLCDYASINRSDWFDCLINSGAYFIKEYIKSRTWALHQTEEK